MWAHPSSSGPEDKIIIQYLLVDPEWQGKGVGRLLMEKAEEIAKEKGIKRIELMVLEGNPAIGFYEKLGYRAFARVMFKDLDG